ncbi:DUF433 domain-containing protein [Fischerella thermalis]|uniref:DUF433 domain-containing protein n=1 Tax=Fischerella thermalis CCMEE 5318 TaxID=2019666 RepID=A0A2N6L4J6_9CYAN|nr:DUF433 domain-containing protein [Fischerella thermalis]MCL6536130.1 DUF433 domain-containing protein [Armatimonadota bacterium]PMB15877.1 hypothetical protein CEN46_25390 [Fischerella thermalis CCMEE 5318]
MTVTKSLDRIVIDPSILSGKPCIRGTRISVEFLLELFASGASKEDILRAYPQLEPEDIEQALSYVISSIRNETILDVPVKSVAHDDSN